MTFKAVVGKVYFDDFMKGRGGGVNWHDSMHSKVFETCRFEHYVAEFYAIVYNKCWDFVEIYQQIALLQECYLGIPQK